MKKSEMTIQLQQSAETLKQELNQLQDTFNNKKEQYVKIMGALEALSLLDEEKEDIVNE
jgi:hypothetical protein